MDPTDWNPRSFPARAGDLIIWQSTLPHGIGINRTKRLRLAQYITMSPVEQFEQEIAFSMTPRDPQARYKAIEHYSSQNVVASALGARAGYAEKWISGAKQKEHEIHEQIPSPRFGPQLTQQQIDALPDLLTRAAAELESISQSLHGFRDEARRDRNDDHYLRILSVGNSKSSRRH